MYGLIRPLLFRLEPERAHALTLSLLRTAGRFGVMRGLLHRLYAAPDDPVQVFGLRFRNRLGLAAGYDKDGLAWRGLACLGFGHIEVGTVTPLPQPGNPKPRLFRLPEERALINRMGFPGRGAEFVRGQLGGRRPYGAILGVNLGINKDTPLERAHGDYLRLLESFAPLADYLAINVSSPNTPGLRSLQSQRALEELLGALAERREALSEHYHKRVPLLVKLAPDLDEAALDGALEAMLRAGMDGAIATNTTVERPRLRSRFTSEPGGLSGAPLRERSLHAIRHIARVCGGRLPIIGCGGVMEAADVKEMLEAGASLVQVYTGLVYEGPGLIRKIGEG